MERLIDKVIVIACCMTALLFTPFDSAVMAFLLLALTASALFEALRGRMRSIPLLVFAAAIPFFPMAAMFLPLIVYDSVRADDRWVRLIGPVGLALSFPSWPATAFGGMALACAVAFLLSLRTGSIVRERADYRHMRDKVREASLSMEAKNRDLQEARDMQVRLATLSERGRIAREIHDNVGHLLTRAIMQAEAFRVVNASDPQAAQGFAEVGETLHAAMDTVRASVHDLRDDALDVREQLEEALDGCGIEESSLDYHVGSLPAETGYCLIAIVREALSNTVRHSDARRIDVSLAEYTGLYQLVVHDNGTVDPFAAQSAMDGGRGMGLQTMEDRVRSLGGVLRVEYRAGLRVFASVPKKGEGK